MLSKAQKEGRDAEEEWRSNRWVAISLKLAKIYAAQDKGDYDAEAGFKFCIETQDRKVNSGKRVFL